MAEPLSDKIRNITLTEAGKKPSKPVIFITNPERAKTLDDPAKVDIIRTLRAGIEDTQTLQEYHPKTKETLTRQWSVKRYALSVVEIVKQSKRSGVNPITRNQVYHHLPNLIENGFVIKYGTVKKGKRTTDYFRRTADAFVFPEGSPALDEKFIAKRLAKDIESIDHVFGFTIPESEHQEFIDLGLKVWEIKDKYAVLILQDLREDLVDSRSLQLYDWLLELLVVGSDEYVELARRMGEIIFKGKKE